MEQLSDIKFGQISSSDYNWRKDDLKELDDDELLEKTPDDIIAMLGFDPKEL